VSRHCEICNTLHFTPLYALTSELCRRGPGRPLSSALVCFEQRTEPQVCATRLHGDDQPQSKSARCCCTKGVEAYKKEGPKFVQRLVAKQKVRVKDS
jgi:hypothetical protein